MRARRTRQPAHLEIAFDVIHARGDGSRQPNDIVEASLERVDAAAQASKPIADILRGEAGEKRSKSAAVPHALFLLRCSGARRHSPALLAVCPGPP